LRDVSPRKIVLIASLSLVFNLALWTLIAYGAYRLWVFLEPLSQNFSQNTDKPT
jgi:hypothetical protein